MSMLGDVLLRDLSVVPAPAFGICEATAPADRAAYHRLRRRAFVDQQGLFSGTDLDDRDADERTIVLVAKAPDGSVIGGVRLGPATDGPDLGWWQGGRLVTDPRARARLSGVGEALVRAACARAENSGVLRFDALVRQRHLGFFERIGWTALGPADVNGSAHQRMRWPIGRVAARAAATKQGLGRLLTGLLDQASTPGFRGDDGSPVPGTDLIAACDAILPSMVERDPEWAGWCAVLVNLNDLAAMGAAPVALLDTVAARDTSFASRIVTGLRRASQAYAVPVIGGHTQLGVPAALSVTALGRTGTPVAAGGGRRGQQVRLTADLGGQWRPGYAGQQWDSTSSRTTGELRAMLGSVADAAPSAAKDVSMAGLAGTLGMLAEASGCGAVLDVAAVPRPADATVGDWFTCFPGFAMITVAAAAAPLPSAGPAVSAPCGELTAGAGVALRWPDGDLTTVIAGQVTGLGTA
jgi:putative N-acetyltransferase (TIGR04045 family)